MYCIIKHLSFSMEMDLSCYLLIKDFPNLIKEKKVYKCIGTYVIIVLFIGLLFGIILKINSITMKLNEDNRNVVNFTNRLTKCENKLNTLSLIVTNYKNDTHSTIRAKITAYCPILRGINSDSNHNKTATMDKPIPGFTAAISRDLLKLGWMHKKIFIYGYGVFFTNDLLANSIRGPQIDICVGSKKTAYKIGVNKDVIVVKLMTLY